MSLTIESRHADQKMHGLLDSYAQKTPPNRRRQPLEVDYYEWGKVNPDLVSPTVKLALRFVAHVERPPQIYAGPILEAADRDGVTSLERFIAETWLPEETQHGVLLRQAAISCGAVSEEELDRELAKIDQLDFPIGRGYTAGMAATYGWTQELITHLFYIAMRKNTQDPVLKEALADLAAQEMFHSRIYDTFRRGVATPKDTVSSIREFQMPGHITSPELQKQSTSWAHELGFNFQEMRHVLATGIVEQAGYQGLGQVATSELIRNDLPRPLRAVLSIADRIHNPAINGQIGRIAARIAGVKLKTAA
ncbi:MAG: acyl-ACP desaturase [Candidatus Daviesbacteria bacterium]|nr:acyl-ACP desaturase [Candidatus Daviesbacteria bacterium]